MGRDIANLTFMILSVAMLLQWMRAIADSHGAVRELWRLVRPNGLLAITIWGRGLFEPADGTFWEAVRREDSELYRSIKPWSKIFEPAPLRALLLECGVCDPEAMAEPGWHPLQAPEDWWTIVLGTGYRSTVEALSQINRERVRTASIDGVRRADIRRIRTDVVYATSRRPADCRATRWVVAFFIARNLTLIFYAKNGCFPIVPVAIRSDADSAFLIQAGKNSFRIKS